jgi:hypothetical protein
MKFSNQLSSFETALKNEINRLTRILSSIEGNPAGAVPIHSSQPVRKQARRTNTLTANCGVWLLAFLRKGPQPAKMVLAAGEKQGYREDTLKTASLRVGIKKIKQSQRDGRGPWCWSKP